MMSVPGIQPRIIAWDKAAEHLRSDATALLARQAVVVIGITGPVGAGKSTLARAISQCVVSTDWYLPDYDLVEDLYRDRPELADLDRLAENLAELRAGKGARVPMWSFVSHSRAGLREMQPAPIVVCEGIHALHGDVRPHLDIGVFVEAPRSVRWSRWEQMERDGQKGWTVEVAREHFHAIAEPTFARYADEYRRHSGVVVVNDQDAIPPA